MRWRFHTIPGPGEKGHESWSGESWRYGGGATWMTGSYDAEANLLYWGVGNAAADLNAALRRGDNLYTDSVIALGRNEPERGKVKLLCPSTIGGKSWNQSAWSPRTGWVYIPVLEICSDLIVRDEVPQEGRGFTGGNWIMKPPPGAKQEGYLAAFDPITGKRQWSVPATTWLLASVLATAGDLIFTGDPEGNFFALDARTGERLWSFPTGAGHRVRASFGRHLRGRG